MMFFIHKDIPRMPLSELENDLEAVSVKIFWLSLPVYSFNALIIPILRGCLQSLFNIPVLFLLSVFILLFSYHVCDMFW